MPTVYERKCAVCGKDFKVAEGQKASSVHYCKAEEPKPEQKSEQKTATATRSYGRGRRTSNGDDSE